jgi:hypothetical protein
MKVIHDMRPALSWAPEVDPKMSFLTGILLGLLLSFRLIDRLGEQELQLALHVTTRSKRLFVNWDCITSTLALPLN